MTKKQKIYFLAVVLLAVFFRFYQINQMPGGLFPDEAANGLDINLMQQGQLQPFYERGNGREALFFYLEWASVAVFGKGAWQMHVASASVGLFGVIVCFLVTRRLLMVGEKWDDTKALSRSVNIALLAAFLMAVSTWHTVLSRTGFRANMIPLFAGLTFYFLLKTYQAEGQRKKYFNAFLTGAVFSLGFYTYIAYRILAPIIVVLILWPWFAVGIKEGVRRYWKQFLLFALASVAFFYPLFSYFRSHPGSFVGRSGQVSVFNPELNGGDLIGTILEVTRLSILGYFTEGDLNWRHNISGFPFLSPLYSPFFAVALAAVTVLGVLYFFSPRRRQGWWKYAALAAWFWGLLLPVITTAEGIPHGLRSIGTIPAVFIISAIGLYKFGEYVWRLHSKFCNVGTFRNWLVGTAFKLTVFCFLLALVLQSYFAYFVYAYNSPENFYSFRSDLSPVSAYLKARCGKLNTYLVLDKFSVQSTDFLTSDRHGNFSDSCSVPYVQVDPEDSWKLSNLKDGDQVIFAQSSIFDIKKFKQHHPEARLVLEVRNKFGQAVMAVYEVGN